MQAEKWNCHTQVSESGTSHQGIGKWWNCQGNDGVQGPKGLA
jgi:hypothetical protein